jgi:hypothetical protein
MSSSCPNSSDDGGAYEVKEILPIRAQLYANVRTIAVDSVIYLDAEMNSTAPVFR